MRQVLLALGLLAPTPAVLPAQAAPRGTVVIVVGQEPNLPVPSLGTGRANSDAAELLFLRLARPATDLRTSGDHGFTPELARRWTRRDSLTLAFELDPGARWHDGTPVSARDVVFAFSRARDARIDPQKALLLRYVQSVAAESERTVVLRFDRAYGEQLYDATWHVPPLPAHLLDTIPAERLATSAYAQRPIGNGPYRHAGREAGQRVEFLATPDFFLGRPGITRVVVLLARDPEAQLNLLLDGTGDVLDNVTPISNVARVTARSDLRVTPVPTFTVGYLLFNQRGYGDRGSPHPILADRDVRRALALAIDRTAVVRATFGDYATVAEGPVSQLHWIRDPDQRATAFDRARARSLLAASGWRDTDGDGVLDRNGQPLTLRLNYPAPSAPRAMIAQLVQEQLRTIGVRIELVRLDGPVWAERRGKGEFDIDFSSAQLDPSPAGLVQSWSCAGRSGSNVGQYCSPDVDALMERAILGRGDVRSLWRTAIRLLNEDAPAVFVFAPANAMAIHRRFTNAVVRPEGWWSGLWQWRITAGSELPRDLPRPGA